ncbi:MAG: hypothetical protein R6V29_13970 [Spirochaetia bacterium]
MSKQKQEELVAVIRKYLDQDPTISDPSKILVSAERRGGLFNKRTVLTLEGKAQNDAEARVIAEMVGAKVADEAEIENRLTAN